MRQKTIARASEKHNDNLTESRGSGEETSIRNIVKIEPIGSGH